MDPELLARIAELLGVTVEEVQALALEDLEELLVAAFDAGAAPEEGEPDLVALTAITEATESVRAAIAAAETAEADRLEQIEELRTRVQPPTAETPAPEGDPDVPPDPEAPAEPAAPEVVPTQSDAPPAPEEAQVPVAASADTPAPIPMRRRRPAAHAPVAQASEDGMPVITAAAEVPGYSAGAPIRSLRDVGAAFVSRLEGFRSATGDGKVPVARIRTQWPESRMLGPDPRHNAELVDAVVGRQPIHAAGGLCAPPAVRYEIENVSVATRPVRDALAQFNAARGGIQVPSAAAITAPDAGVGVVTASQDHDNTTKPCVVITCPTYSEVDISAVYQCLTIGNFAARTFPELFAHWWAKATALHARKAEGALLDGIGDHPSTLDVIDGQNLGAARDTIEAIIRAVAQQRSRHRAYDVPFRCMAPRWLLDMVHADLVREKSSTDSRIAITEAQLNAIFASAGVNMTWYYDTEEGDGQVYGAQLDGNSLNPWNLAPVVYIFTEGAFLFLDGGTLDLGMEIRDSTLNLHNNVNAFTESFENVAFVGDVPALKLTLTLCVSGASSLPVVVTCPENS